MFPKQITQAKVAIKTPYGNVENSWEMKGAKFSMNLKVPFNTKARVILTKKEIESLVINGEEWKDFRMKKHSIIIGDSTIVLGSGIYQIKYDRES